MCFKSVYTKIRDICRKYFFNRKWRCVVCGKEIFNGGYFCDGCKAKLPYNDGAKCNHCGRQTKYPTERCSTCKGVLVSVDKARSVFRYEEPISDLIKKAKYYKKRYLLETFSESISNEYYKNYFKADYLTFVPMTDKAKRKRGYNQSQTLCELTAERVGVPVFYGVEKKRETSHQASLGRSERLKNLIDAYKITDKKQIEDKSVLIIDDVTTTGATSEALAGKLKKAGAKEVMLLTVASVPPKDKW